MRKKFFLPLVAMVALTFGISEVSGIPKKPLTDLQVKNLEALTGANSTSAVDVVCDGSIMDNCYVRCTTCGAAYVGKTHKGATSYRGQCPKCGGVSFSLGLH